MDKAPYDANFYPFSTSLSNTALGRSKEIRELHAG
jgi:hypothetical protein